MVFDRNQKKKVFFFFYSHFSFKTHIKNYDSKRDIYDKIKGRKILERAE
jgi:hypothetical protein